MQCEIVALTRLINFSKSKYGNDDATVTSDPVGGKTNQLPFPFQIEL